MTEAGQRLAVLTIEIGAAPLQISWIGAISATSSDYESLLAHGDLTEAAGGKATIFLVLGTSVFLMA